MTADIGGMNIMFRETIAEGVDWYMPSDDEVHEMAQRFRPRPAKVYTIPSPILVRTKQAFRAYLKWEDAFADRVLAYLRASLADVETAQPNVAMDNVIIAALRQGAYGGITVSFDFIVPSKTRRRRTPEKYFSTVQDHSLLLPRAGRSIDSLMADADSTRAIQTNGRLSVFGLWRARRYGFDRT